MVRLPLVPQIIAKSKGIVRKQAEAEGVFGDVVRHALDAYGTVSGYMDSRHWPARPESINIELTAICDARCIHCPREDMNRSQRPMDLALFKRLIDQATELQVPEICPNGFGELLTMQNLGVYLSYIREKKHQFQILINSNGYRLSDEKIETFIDNHVDLLNITLDGATAETFEAIRVKLKFADIEDNIHRLLKRRKERGVDYPKLRVGMILIKQNEHEVGQFLERWRGVADFVGVGGFTNRAASRDPSLFQSETQAPEAAHACVLPFREMNIWADGRAVLCCDDWNEEHPVGDLNRQTLAEIWHGPALQKARELHMAKRGADIGICAGCSYWREPAGGIRLWA